VFVNFVLWILTLPVYELWCSLLHAFSFGSCVRLH